MGEMADGGQRLLDVIDDPNALESFLGGLTSASDLLPSAESVDTVVASLAQLGADYEVDSPNETLFDTLEASNNLTDISQSYVPSDFENENVYNTLTNGAGSFENDLGHLAASSDSSSTHNQAGLASQTPGSSGTDNAGDINVEALVSSTLQEHQYQNSICDSNTTTTATSTATCSFVQSTQGHGEQEEFKRTQGHVKVEGHVEKGIHVNAGYNETFSQLIDIQSTQETQSISQSTSLSIVGSSTTSIGSVSENSITASSSSGSSLAPTINVSEPSVVSSAPCLDSATSSCKLPAAVVSSTPGKLISNFVSESNSSSINNEVKSNQVVTQTPVTTFVQQQSHHKTVVGNQELISISSGGNTLTQIKSEAVSSAANVNIQLQQHVPQQSQQTQQQYIVNSGNISQFLQQGQTVSLSGLGQQLISSTTNVVPNVMSGGQGTTNLMQIQSAPGQPQQFIAIDQSTQSLIGSSGFGGGNLALVSTGGTPTYAVLNSGSQLFSNTIQVQPQQLQALKSPGQTYFQTPSGSIVAANGLHSLSNVQSVSIPTSNSNVVARGKQQPPQILPKPASQAPNTSAATNTVQSGTGNTTSIAISDNSCNQATLSQGDHSAQQQVHQQQQQQHAISVSVGQIFHQHQQQQIHQVQTNQGIMTSVSNPGLSFATQPTFTFSGGNGLGQVMVSNVGQMGQQHSQLGGTLVLNQFGQPVLLPTAGTSQNNGLQFILRQQPAQPQVLTIQTSAGAAQQPAATKPIVRYVPQMPQNQTVQIQQIQTPNGPAYIAVRCPSTTQQASQQQFISPSPQFQTETIIQSPVQQQAHQIKVEPQVRPQTSPSPQILSQGQSQNITSHIVSGQQNGPIHLSQQQGANTFIQRPQITIKTDKGEQLPLQNYRSPNQVIRANTIATPPPKVEPIPDKTTPTTPKRKPPKKKKKVMLDLDEILKQSGIGDEDLQDDSCFENAIPAASSVMTFSADQSSSYFQPQTPTNVNTTTPSKPNGSFTGKTSNLPVNILQSPHVHVLKPTTQAPKTKNSPKNGGGAGSSSKSKNSSPASTKAAPKKSPAKRKSVPEKEIEPPAKVPANKKNNSKAPISAATSPNHNNSPGTGNKKKGNNNNNNNSKTNNKNSSPSNTTKSPAPSKANKKNTSPKTPAPKPQFSGPSQITPNTSSTSAAPGASTPAAAISSQQGASSSTGTSNQPVVGQGQRIVHTIQLTPQNQQLLRNIQAQISRLVALPKRNETEQTALQKLIYLQQQVIATGVTVPNPTALSNLNNNSTVAGSGASVTNSSMVHPQSQNNASFTPNTPHSVLVSTSANSSVMNRSGIAQASATNNDNVMTLTFPSCVNSTAPILLTPSPNTTTSAAKISCYETQSSNVISTAYTTPRQLLPVNTLANSNFTSSTTNGKTIIISSHSVVSTPTNVQSRQLFNKEKTEVVVANNLQDCQAGLNQGAMGSQQFGGATVVVIEDAKLIEQRRAAAKAEEEARARWKTEQFDFLLKRDQDFYVEPDYKTPFTSVEDAVERLMKYHLVRDRTEMDFEDFDDEFSDTAVRLLDKFSNMVHKYRSLMLKESMKEVSCAERVMVERTFCNEEKLKLEQDKLLVAQGEVLDLPPPPDEWVPKLREMVEADLKELEMDTAVNEQVQSAIDSIISCGSSEQEYPLAEDGEKIEYDAFGVPSSSSGYNSMGPSSSADIDEAVRSILC